jgi:hypothetical protein
MKMQWKGLFLVILVICGSFSRNNVSRDANFFNLQNKKEINNNAVTKVFYQNPAFPFFQKNTVNTVKNIDTNELKNSDWYHKAIASIEKLAYNFTWQEEKKGYVNNNIKNGLAFQYNNTGFKVQPLSNKNWNIAFALSNKPKQGFWQTKENTAQYKTPEITVEYLNTIEGMRQNFIVQKPLQNDNELTLDFTLNTKLETAFSNNAVQFYQNKENVFNYSDLHVWDANHNMLAAHFQQKAKDNSYAIVVDTKGATYPITIDPISSTPNQIIESNVANAGIGFSVASAGDVNGDGYSEVIIGAPTYTNGQLNEGAAFLYYGSITGINTSSFVLLEANQANAGFGYSVSTAGDVNGDGYSDIIIGARVYDAGNTDEGAAFIYHGASAGINTTPAAIVESNQDFAQMGNAVACAGDINKDGYSDIIVGAWQYDNGQTNEGVAFVYNGSISGINTTPINTLESNITLAYMGASVASAGDIDGNGFNDVIIGASGYSNGETNEGAAYIYLSSGSGIVVGSLVIKESNQASATMGTGVACAGDINGDGFSDVVIGAEGYSNGQLSEGAAFVYLGSPTGITAAIANSLESNIVNARLGRSVACAGDINGDGYSDVLIGAPTYSNGEGDEGALYLYNGASAGLNTTPTIRESNQASGFLGQSVASAGDVNGDGYSDVLAGAYLYDNGQTDEGVGFVYYGSMNNFSAPNLVLADGLQNSAYAGIAVADAGDVNGDGYSDVLVGSYYNEFGTIADAGRVYVYHGSATGLPATYTYILKSNPIQVSSFVGNALSTAGDINGDGYSDVIVGAYKFDNGNIDEGVALIYYGSSSGLSLTQNVLLDDANQNDAGFGFSVSSAGDVNGDGYSDVMVGAPFYDVGGNIDEGRTYLYYGSNAGINTTPIILNSANIIGALFGNAVSTAGDMNGDGYSDVLVGALKYSTSFTPSFKFEGKVFVYNGSAAGLSTIPSVILNGANKDSCFFGSSVSSAGDVNNDGFNDVIIGAYGNNAGVGDFEGRAFVYYGSATGLSNFSKTTLASGAIPAEQQFGESVASAGDVNNDGYSDVVVGAPLLYDPTREGKIFVYLGSSSGIGTTSYFTVSDANQINAYFGYSVASGGDVNGDGTSDLIIGSPYSFATFNTAGKTFVYYGNAVTGIRNNPKLYLNDLTTTYNSNTGTLNSTFGIGLFSKNFIGRTKGKIAWETHLNYVPFNGNPTSNYTGFTAQQNTLTDLGTNGVELKAVVDKLLTNHSFTKIRVRTKYDPVTAITGQMYGPWKYIQENLTGNWLGALPVELNEFNVSWKETGKSSNINFVVDKEMAMQHYTIEKSTNGANFNFLTKINATNQPGAHQYNYTDNNALAKKQYYRLKMEAANGRTEYSNTILLTHTKNISISLFPNPAKNYITLNFGENKNNVDWQMMNSEGAILQKGKHQNSNSLSINIMQLPKGIYTIRLHMGEQIEAISFVKE